MKSVNYLKKLSHLLYLVNLFKPDFMLSLQLYIFNPNDHCFKTKDLCTTYVTLDPKTSLKSLGYICSVKEFSLWTVIKQ